MRRTTGSKTTPRNARRSPPATATEQIRQRITRLIRALCDIPQTDRDAWWTELNSRYLAGVRLTSTERMVYMGLTHLPMSSDRDAVNSPARRPDGYAHPDRRPEAVVTSDTGTRVSLRL